MGIINIKDLCFRYPVFTDGEQAEADNKNVLDGINLSIEQGEFLSLLGHNGSGKSTLAKMLNGLLIPDSGSVEVFGKMTTDSASLFDIRQNVGMIFQNPDNQMVASIVEDDIAFGAENIGLPQQKIVERVEWALEAVNMSQYRKRTPHRLSGGQKQRIAIAAVLAIKPKVLVLDESTAMLDPQGRDEVMQTVRDLNKNQGITVIHITHFMEEAINSDRVVVLSQGKIVMQGKPIDILTDHEQLQQYRLDVPLTIQTALALQKNNINVKFTFDTEELADDICRLLLKD